MIQRFNDERDWFFEKRFGLFVHWGLYAIPAWHEQIQWRKNMPRDEYEPLINEFNPRRFNPDEWLDMLQEAGMEYICFTTKHHDGFCMWNTKETDYNIMNTPYKKDILAMLADACHKREIPLCLYYSVADWHHPNYPNQGRTHELQPQSGDEPHMEKYVEYLKAQIRELCSNYGQIHGIWWDMNVPQHCDPSVHEMIRSLQPQAVINDRGFQTGVRGIDNGDFTTPEREIPAAGCFEVPTEACQSLGKLSWGYKTDEDYYADKFIIQSIDKALSMGGNYLLNTGPKADGTISKDFKDSLLKIGQWYNKVKESYNADPAPGTVENPAVLVTRKDKLVYIHLNPDPDSTAVKLNPMTAFPEKVILLNSGEKLEWVIDSDTQPCDTAVAALRIRGIPINDFTDQVLVIKLIT